MCLFVSHLQYVNTYICDCIHDTCIPANMKKKQIQIYLTEHNTTHTHTVTVWGEDTNIEYKKSYICKSDSRLNMTKFICLYLRIFILVDFFFIIIIKFSQYFRNRNISKNRKNLEKLKKCLANKIGVFPHDFERWHIVVDSSET